MNKKVCSKCWVEKELTEFSKHKLHKDSLNSWCKLCCKQYIKQWYIDHPKYSKQYYIDNKEKRNQNSKKFTVNNKEKVFNHYGSQCIICGESIQKFLNMDHIDGGGTKHYKEIGNNTLYRWIIKNNFPDEFQTLCANCNWKKHLLSLKPAESLEDKKYRLKLKTLVFNYYGNKCSCCNNSDIDVLSIDHINGGGRNHMKKIGQGGIINGWLVKNNFPEGFQTLCRNCNQGKQINCGICPHKETR